MKENIFPYLEWEILREPITISKVCHTKELPEGQKKIVINRGESYKLRGLLYAKGDFELFTKKKDSIPGSFAETFDIQGYDQSELKHHILESCYIGGGRIRQEDQELLCEVDLGIQGLRTKYRTEAEGTWLTEWYINGPRDNIFRNSTERKLSRILFRERSAPKDEKIHSIKVSRSSFSFTLDFLRVKARGFQFLVTKVPEGIGPEWSSNIGIEYHKDWGRIPGVDEREKISELCSFIFGRQLLSVGCTIYDKDQNMVEGYACNPWGKDPKSLCEEHDIPPIRISGHAWDARAEDLVGQLLPTYYELRKPLHLKEALWLYWISRNIPIGPNLPVLAAAVETIMNGWFDYKKSKTHGVYMNKNEFENLLRPEIAAIQSKLKDEQYGDKIIDCILRANHMGIAERFRFFFDEIKLVVDEHEWNAIDARHDFAHGRIEFDKTKWKPLIRHAQTYETLVHKILLKLLGYSGSYIDRSTVGWPDKKLT